MENLTQSPGIILSAVFFFAAVIFSSLYLSARKKKKIINDPFSNVCTDTQKRVSPKRGRREYKFACGIEAWQEELIWDQDIEVMIVLKEMGIDDFVNRFKNNEEIPVDEFIEALAQKKLLEKLFDAILHVKYKPVNVSWGRLYNSELRCVISDFFTLSPDAKLGLELFRYAAVITQMKVLNPDTETATAAMQ